MPLPLSVCCFSKIRISFTFLVPVHPGSPGQRDVKRVYVCVCVKHFVDIVGLHEKFAFMQKRDTKDMLQAIKGWHSATTYTTPKKIKNTKTNIK